MPKLSASPMPKLKSNNPGGSSAQSSDQGKLTQPRGGKRGQKRTDGSGRQSNDLCPMCGRDFTSPNPLNKYKGTTLPRCRGYGACDICRFAFAKFCKGARETDPEWRAKYKTPAWEAIRDEYIAYRNGEAYDAGAVGRATISSSRTQDRTTQRVQGNFWPEDDLKKNKMPYGPGTNLDGQSLPYWEVDPTNGISVYGVLRECRMDGPPYTLPPGVFQVFSGNKSSATKSRLEDDSNNRLYEGQGSRFSP